MISVSQIIPCLVLLIFTLSVTPKNILTISPVSSPSHSLWHGIISKELVNRGHNVTIIMPDNYTSFQNFTVIHLEDIYKLFADYKHDFENMPKESSFTTVLFKWMQIQCYLELQTNGFKKLMTYPANFFDLIIIDVSTGIECFYPLIKKLGDTPLIGTSPFGLMPWSNIYTGDWLYPSVTPHYAVPYLDHDMTFLERFHNFIVLIHSQIYRKIVERNLMEGIKPYYNEIPADTLSLNKNISMFLINMDSIMGFPRPLLPNVIPVGGIHIRLQNNIPKDMKMWLDNARDGVILFSLGTNVKTSRLSPEKIQILLQAFKKLAPLKVLMKWETDTLSGKPDNVIIQKWLPQYDVLCHPNVKLLFNHGGELSLQEAIYAGKPVLGMPFFLDQKFNMNRVVRRRLGRLLDYTKLTVDDIISSVSEILENTAYRSNIENLARHVKDQPQTPMERGMFWIEYVLRHGHAKELQCTSVHQPFWKMYCLDIFGSILLLLYLVVKIVKLITCSIISLVRGGKKLKSQKSKSKIQ